MLRLINISTGKFEAITGL